MTTFKNKILDYKFIVVFFLLIRSCQMFAATDYMKGKYEVDPMHTRVSFIVPHLVVSEVEGRFDTVKGTFTLAEPFTKSSVTATIPVKSINTGVTMRDDDLRSKNFFEVEKYPEMKLVSKSITGTPDGFRMVAAVTIKDVTQDVEFEGKYTGSVKDPMGKQRAALQMTGTVNRKDFHINYDQQIPLGPAVGEQVKLRLWTEGIYQK